MRILALADLSSYHTEKWVNAYESYGIEVLAVGLEPPLRRRDNYRFIEPLYSSPPLKYISKLNEVKKIKREFNPDIIHAHMAPNYGLLAMLSGTPYVLSLWGPDVLETPRKSPLHRFVLKKIFEKALLLHVDADIMTWILVNKFDICPGKIVNFPYGVSEELLKYGKEKQEGDIAYIVSHRRLEPLYNHEVIIKALRILKYRGFRFRFTFASGGSLQESMKKVISEEGLEKDVEITGFVPPEKLYSILGNSHIFISASLSDTTPVSLLEAMACGCFPIVSDLMANREWVVNGFNGFIFHPHNSEELAMKIIQAYENRELRETACKFNRELVKRKALWEKNFENFLKILKNISEIECKRIGKKAKVPWSWL